MYQDKSERLFFRTGGTCGSAHLQWFGFWRMLERKNLCFWPVTFDDVSQTDLDTNLAVPNFVSPQLRMKHKLANVRPWVASLALGLYFRKKNESPRLHHIEDAEFFLEYAKVVWKGERSRENTIFVVKWWLII